MLQGVCCGAAVFRWALRAFLAFCLWCGVGVSIDATFHNSRFSDTHFNSINPTRSLSIIGPAMARGFLPPHEAFKLQLKVHEATCTQDCLIDVLVEVAPRYYLYREQFRVDNTLGLAELSIDGLPNGERLFDPFLKKEVQALRGVFQFQIRYGLGQNAATLNTGLLGQLSYQGCADAGLCYPPMVLPITTQGPFISSGSDSVLDDPLSAGQKALSSWLQQDGTMGSAQNPDGLGVPIADGQYGAAQLGQDTAPFGAPTQPLSLKNDMGFLDGAESLAQQLASGAAWHVLLIFFGLGLLLAFTPCSLPMLPILSGLVVGDSVSNQSTSKQWMRPFGLAAIYVLGMSISFAALGVLAGLTGKSLAAALQSAWLLGGFAVVLAILGVLLVLDVNVQLPSAWQSFFQQRMAKVKGGKVTGVAVMGVLSALLVGPCLTAPLAGALLYIGQTGNAVLGGLALFMLAWGMGLPLMLVSAGAAHLVPKAGPWMQGVRFALGLVLFASALWVVRPIMPLAVWMSLWALWFGVLAQGLFTIWGQAKHFVSRSIALALAGVSVLLSVVYALGMILGSTNPRNPLEPVLPIAFLAQPLSPVVIEDVASVAVMDKIVSSPVPVMLDFYADWCVSCHEFEQHTLTHPDVIAGLDGIRVIRVDVTKNTPYDQALMKHFGVFGPPAFLFFAPRSDVLVHRVMGFENGEDFTQTLLNVRPLLGLLGLDSTTEE